MNELKINKEFIQKENGQNLDNKNKYEDIFQTESNEKFNEDELLDKFDKATPDFKIVILKELKKIGTKKTIDYLCEVIKKYEDCLFDDAYQGLFEIDYEYSFEKSIELLEFLDPRKNSINEWVFPRLIEIIAHFVGVEKMRSRLLEIISKKKEKDENADSYEYAFSLITPSSDKTAIMNLQNFYQENIKFEEYKLNQEMNEREASFLKELIKRDEKVFEMGCGTGRLFLEMKKAGYDVVGTDFTPRHIKIIKEQQPDAKIFEADWHNTKMQGGEYDAVYSLGRNILHDYSIIDQVATFREAMRILKDGGKFIFDIPNREKGAYKQMVEGYAEEMKKRSIKNFRYGTIYDSPDGENFATRYAYSREDIGILSQITGFEIEDIKVNELKTGNGDENLYYVLKKKVVEE